MPDEKYCPRCDALLMGSGERVTCVRCGSDLVEIRDNIEFERDGYEFTFYPSLKSVGVAFAAIHANFKMRGNIVVIYGREFDTSVTYDEAVEALKIASDLYRKAPASYGGFNGRSVFVDQKWVKVEFEKAMATRK